MKLFGSKAIRTALGTAASLAVVVAIIVFAATDVSAQFANSRQPTISPVPPDFTGTWRWNTPRQSCGSTRDSYGNIPVAGAAPVGSGLVLCQWPIDQLEKVMNGRMRLWQKDFASDDAMSPRWTCQASGLGTILTETYLRTFIRRPEALVMWWEQSEHPRYVFTDGRKHASAIDSSFFGDSIGWMEGKTFVVETTNFTWDVDGYDDQAHLPRSHMAKWTERYTLKDEDNMELAITVEDPLFLREPFTFVGSLRRTRQEPVNSWDCDPEVAARELYSTFKNPHPDDNAGEKYFDIK